MIDRSKITPLWGAAAGALLGFLWAWLGLGAVVLIAVLAGLGYVVSAVLLGELDLGGRSSSGTTGRGTTGPGGTRGGPGLP